MEEKKEIVENLLPHEHIHPFLRISCKICMGLHEKASKTKDSE